MKLYSENEKYKLYQGNMLDMLEVIEPNSIDSVICDPPYELNFMSKSWDNSGIAFQPSTWQKCYEALKPGGYLLAFGGSRTFHRIACAIEDAGFEIRDTIMWLYGSGFPKSMDISKQIDKKGGVDLNWFADFLNKTLKEKNTTTIELAEKGKFYGKVNHGGLVSNWAKGKTTPTPEQFNKMCKILELPFEDIEEVEREVIGKQQYTNSKKFFEYDGERVHLDITIPSTELAKQWQGWATALKPSFEPIIVARKPFKGSLVDNVIEYGVGGINIDECRISTEEDLTRNCLGRASARHEGYYRPCFEHAEKKVYGSTNGRFPANTILTYDETDFDEVCGGFPKDKGYKPHKVYSNIEKYEGYGSITKKQGEMVGYGDSGSASRYFYCAKASKKDRDEGCQELEDTFNACSNQAIAEQKRGNNNFADEKNSTFNKVYVGKNTHPTVKPTELMQYLVRLVTPNNGTILDPFNGSGSTGKAVMYENKERNKNYKYIGIELTEEYLPISKARIEYVCNLKPEVNPQISIFDFIGDKDEIN